FIAFINRLFFFTHFKSDLCHNFLAYTGDEIII
ncbi:MAG: hypothetical protein ACI8W9_000608, partial [Psychromonas sp.]